METRFIKRAKTVCETFCSSSAFKMQHISSRQQWLKSINSFYFIINLFSSILWIVIHHCNKRKEIILNNGFYFMTYKASCSYIASFTLSIIPIVKSVCIVYKIRDHNMIVVTTSADWKVSIILTWTFVHNCKYKYGSKSLTNNSLFQDGYQFMLLVGIVLGAHFGPIIFRLIVDWRWDKNEFTWNN